MMLQLFETSQDNKYHLSKRKQSQEHGKRLHKMTYIDFKYAIKLSFIKNSINHRPFEKCHPGCKENGIYSVRGQKYKNRYLACIIINDNGNSMTIMIITRKGGVCYCVCPFF